MKDRVSPRAPATLALALLLASAPARSEDGAAAAVSFTDVSAKAGIHFVHNSGRFGKKLLPEALGPGAAFLDADGDGWLDILIVNGRDWKPKGKKSLPALYHNQRNGTFTDVTVGSGLDVELYAMGAAIGDYDNDGRPDVYVTALEGDRLFRNDGKGKFRDVTRPSGIDNADFGTSAAWLDYDRDGLLDLFVANYVKWTMETDLWCSLDGATKSYCTPESYTGTRSRLYRGLGGGKFEDATDKAGLGDPTSKSLGVAVLDFDGDGWPDIFVANDTQPNKLYRNTGKGAFVEVGLDAGVAFSEDGVARGAMGVDFADYDRSGRPHLIVGNFANEMLGLYHNEGSGLFVDDAPRTTVGRASLLSLTFGVFFVDYDLDGYPDLFAANGHLEEEIENVQPKVKYRQPPLLFRNVAGREFADVSARVGADLGRPVVGRGAAHGDFDRDGDRDILLTVNHGPAHLFRNDGGNRNHWLNVRTIGRKSNRDGIGALVRVASESGKQWDRVRSGSSYCSQSDLSLTFGLGKDTKVKTIELEWPSGVRQKFADIDADQFLVIDEERGIVSRSGPAK